MTTTTSELAYNLNGDPFEVPPGASGWRVRRMKHKGAPEVAYARNGQPLVMPLEAEVDDLRAQVSTPGRYRLDPVDENNRPIEGAPVGYVYVHDLASAAPVAPDASDRPIAALGASSESIVIEAMRMNAEIARAVVHRFPQIMEASAVLLRAADGAGIPARASRVIEADREDDDDTDNDDDDGEPAPRAKAGIDLAALLQQLAPAIMALLGDGGLNLGALLDWRKAAPSASRALGASPAAARAPVSPERGATSASSPTQSAAAPSAAHDTLPSIDAATMAHFIAIQSALAPDEAALAREVAGELAPADLRAWFHELTTLSVPDAVAKIRTLIGGAAPRKGGAS